jgi:hypothetical protein
MMDMHKNGELDALLAREGITKEAEVVDKSKKDQ